MASSVVIHAPSMNCGAKAELIMRALPDWFGIEEGIVSYIAAAQRMPTVVATEDSVPVGFMTIEQHFPHAAELHVLGVVQTHHRQGVGRRLLEVTEAWLRERDVRWLQVKTLAPSRECKFYEQSRRWYEAMGFEPLQVFPLLWDPSNPALQLIKRL